MSDFAAGFASGAGQVIPGAIQERERRVLQKQQLDDEAKFRASQLAFQEKELLQRQTQLDAMTKYYDALSKQVLLGVEDPSAKRIRESEAQLAELKVRGLASDVGVAEATKDTKIEQINLARDAAKAEVERAVKEGKWTDRNMRLKFMSGLVGNTVALAQSNNEKGRLELAKNQAAFEQLANTREFGLRQRLAERGLDDLTDTEKMVLGQVIQDAKDAGASLTPADIADIAKDVRGSGIVRRPVFSGEEPVGGTPPKGRPSYMPERVGYLQADTDVLKSAAYAFGNPNRALTPDQVRGLSNSETPEARSLWNNQKVVVIPNPKGGYAAVRVDANKYEDAMATLQQALGTIENIDMRTPEQVQSAINVIQTRYNTTKTFRPEPRLPSGLGTTLGPKF